MATDLEVAPIFSVTVGQIEIGAALAGVATIRPRQSMVISRFDILPPYPPRRDRSPVGQHL